MGFRATGDVGLIIGGIFAILGSAGAFYYYLRETASITGGWIMAGLRSVAVALLLLMFIEPVVYTTQTVGKRGKVFLFADRTESMSLKDPNFSPDDRLRLMLSHDLIEKEKLNTPLIEADRLIESVQERVRRARDKPPGQAAYQKLAEQVAKDLESATDRVEEMPVDAFLTESGGDESEGIQYDLWTEVSNGSGNNLKSLLNHPDYPDEPDQSRNLSSLSRSEALQHYGSRTYGFVRPPESGQYTFYLLTDDAGRLNLSTSMDPAGRRTIANVPDHVKEKGNWKKAVSSSPVNLKKGRMYFIEVLQTQGEGPAHVQVGWKRPNGTKNRPIPARYLAPPDANFPPKQAKKAIADTLKTELVKKAQSLAESAGGKTSTAKLNKALDTLGSGLSDLRDRYNNLYKRYARYIFSEEKNTSGEISDAIEKLKKLKKMSRWKRLRSILRADDRLLTELSEEHDVQLWTINDGAPEQLGKFSEEDGDEATDEEPPASADTQKGNEKKDVRLGQIKPDAPKTNLGAALEKTLSARSETDTKSAAVLLTDGQHNHGESPLTSAGILGSREMPVYTVGIGSDVSPEDLGIVGIEAPETVFYKNKISGQITLKDQLKKGEKVRLSIQAGEDEQVWEEKYKPSEKGLEKISFNFPVEELVKKLKKKEEQSGEDEEDGTVQQSRIMSFNARIETPESDSHEGNDEHTFHTTVVTRNRNILLIDGRPRWEFRYIRNFFNRDPQWEVDHLLTNPFYGDENKMKVPAEEKKLKKYDLIVFGEVPPDTINKKQLKWIRTFATERGGGLIFIDGDRGHLKKYEDTPLEDLIPVKWPSSEQEGEGDGEEGVPEEGEEGDRSKQEKPRYLQLTEKGLETTAFQVGSDREETQEKLKEFPAPHWTASVEPFPGTETYMEAVYEDRTQPVAVARQQGAGRILYMGIDEIWRWRYREANEFHRKFWQQIVSWTAEKPFTVRNDTMALATDKSVYERKEVARIRARLYTEKQPDTIQAVLKREKDEEEGEGEMEAKQSIELRKIEGRRGLYRGTSSPLSEKGAYRLNLNVEELEDKKELEQKLNVTEPVNKEFTFLRQNNDLLKEISNTSGGNYYREDQARELISALDPLSDEKEIRHDIVVWQSWWFFLPVVLLLTGEWVCRKWYGLI